LTSRSPRAGVVERVESAGVQPGRATFEYLDPKPAPVEVGTVHVGDLVLTTRGRLESSRYLEHVVVVEVQPRDGETAPRSVGLLLQRECHPVFVELDDAIGLGVADVVGEHGSAVEVAEALQLPTEPGPVEEVVAQNQGRGLVADEVGADHEGLRQSVRSGLLGEGDVHAVLRAVAQEPLELLCVMGCGDDQDVADAGKHQGAERVVDHRLVVDRQQLLRDHPGQRI